MNPVSNSSWDSGKPGGTYSNLVYPDWRGWNDLRAARRPPRVSANWGRFPRGTSPRLFPRSSAGTKCLRNAREANNYLIVRVPILGTRGCFPAKCRPTGFLKTVCKAERNTSFICILKINSASKWVLDKPFLKTEKEYNERNLSSPNVPLPNHTQAEGGFFFKIFFPLNSSSRPSVLTCILASSMVKVRTVLWPCCLDPPS
jgi:hypothetical protein